MQKTIGAAIFSACITAWGCASPASAPGVNSPPTPINSNAAVTPASTSSVPKNGDYPGKGKVTKIDHKLGSVELDHEEIKGVMPAMRMEFYVTDPTMLKALAVGDTVDFTLRYRDGQEIISAIAKAQ